MHRCQNLIAPFLDFIGMLGRRKDAIRSGDDAGKHRCFGQCECPQVLSKIRCRPFAKAVNTEGSALAKVHLVGIHGEDLLLGQALLQQQ